LYVHRFVRSSLSLSLFLSLCRVGLYVWPQIELEQAGKVQIVRIGTEGELREQSQKLQQARCCFLDLISLYTYIILENNLELHALMICRP
jgi:hypothetical protein